jgi:hypothetical protein
MDLDPNDSIGLWIEIMRAAEGLHPDDVFLERLWVAATQRTNGKKLQQLLQSRCIPKRN